jgi:hypothetical protein
LAIPTSLLLGVGDWLFGEGSFGYRFLLAGTTIPPVAVLWVAERLKAARKTQPPLETR